jgi:four helix bundle protein
MMKIERFEDIEGWQEARVLARMVYGVSDKGQFARDFPLRRQIEDATASVMANIAEGFDAGSDAEFIRFLCYARRSASEVQSHLYIALDRGYVGNVGQIGNLSYVYPGRIYTSRWIEAM